MTIAQSNRVLVVSPDPGLVNQVRGSLVSVDVIDVSDVATAEEALERCEGGGPRLVVAEVDLPGITGNELCRRLKERDGCPAVVLVFRDGDDRAEEQCSRVGADATVGRPFPAQDLVSMLQAIITSAAFNSPREQVEQPDPGATTGEEDSVGDESLYSDYEFGVDESVDGMRSIDTGSIRAADTAEMDAVKALGKFDEAEQVEDLHAESSVKIASLNPALLEESSSDPFQTTSPQSSPPGQDEAPGGGVTLREMVASHLNDLTSEGSDFRNELKTLIRETVSEAVLAAAGSGPDDGAEPGSEDS